MTNLHPSISQSETTRVIDAVPAFERGARVTNQRRTYFDGMPVAGWPAPQFQGTVRKVVEIAGCAYARVKWDSGRLEYVHLDYLTAI